MKLVLGKKDVFAPVSERMARFIMPVTESGCHLWVGAVGPTGYGSVGLGSGKIGIAHRVAYELARGPIPEGMQIDHLCRVRCCVNPDHLEVVTAFENTMRSTAFTAVNKAKTHCPKGHPYSGENLRVHANGYRRCKACHRSTYLRFLKNHPGYKKNH